MGMDGAEEPADVEETDTEFGAASLDDVDNQAEEAREDVDSGDEMLAESANNPNQVTKFTQFSLIVLMALAGVGVLWSLFAVVWKMSGRRVSEVKRVAQALLANDAEERA